MSAPKDTHLKRVQTLSYPISRLKGIGPARSALLMKKGIRTVLDLLYFIPRRYEDRTSMSSIGQAVEGENSLVKGRVVRGGEELFPRSRKRIFRILITDGAGVMELIWFRYRKPHLASYLSGEKWLAAYGRVQRGPHRMQIVHPEIREMDERGREAPGFLGIYPVYSAIGGMTPSAIRKVAEASLREYLHLLIDPVPEQIRKENRLPDLDVAIRTLHLPPASSHLRELNDFDTPFHKRILFDRFFLIMLVVAFLKRRRFKRAAPKWTIPSHLEEDLKRLLPFDLTVDQRRALAEILQDVASGKAMGRLLMGDVGCGKTIIAALAAFLCTRNGYQAALMAPTQVLARQHLEYFQNLAPALGFRPVLITGGLKRAERATLYEKVGQAKYDLVIGTHSLIQEGLSFRNLGLVIIDEQQRFGVRERAMLDHKGVHAHQLVMTATPIPRTLAIAVYGDMDLSEIRQFPKGKAPVQTYLAGRDRKREVFDQLKRRLAQGQQAFVICPAIEDQEEDIQDAVRMERRLKALLSPPYEIGLIHGRLSAEQREEVMERFRKGLLQILVGTTVVEVGVHVPGATVMIIEHPERFGLSQLHQLRGRVGRGSEPGVCFLMATSDLSEKALSRLGVLVEYQDGFEIARRDLEQRGYGQFGGTRQAGTGELDIAEMLRESDLFLKAKNAAEVLLDADPELSRPEHRPLKAFLDSMITGPVDF